MVYDDLRFKADIDEDEDFPTPELPRGTDPVSDSFKSTDTASRFDLEDQIMGCWNVVNELRLLKDAFNSGSTTIGDFDDALGGVAALYDLKFNCLWEAFEELVHSKKIT